MGENQDGKRKRVNCPVDPRHTVLEDQVESHILKCSARVTIPEADWYKENFNITEISQVCDPVDTKLIDYREWYNRLQSVYDKILKQNEPEVVVLNHVGMEKRFGQLENLKHPVQQGSLIGHMQRIGVLELSDNTIIEFGCGRAELSRYVNNAQFYSRPDPAYKRKFLLVDRAGHRMKFDTKLLKDYNEIMATEKNKELFAQTYREPEVFRIKADIKDLDLVEGLKAMNGDETLPGSICAISKHLCGCATDLTLQCLFNGSYAPRSEAVSDSKPALRGIVIALCCRHICNYQSYPISGRKFLESNGIVKTPQDFQTLAKMTSWAVCSRRPGIDVKDTELHYSKLSVEEREQCGLWARRFIDYGRVQSLRELGMNTELYQYVTSDISLENVALVARWPDAQDV